VADTERLLRSLDVLKLQYQSERDAAIGDPDREHMAPRLGRMADLIGDMRYDQALVGRLAAILAGETMPSVGFTVTAHRSGQLGEATADVKEGGEVVFWDDLEAARKAASDLNDRTSFGSNVRYVANPTPRRRH
jgi:hypothetical protein